MREKIKIPRVLKYAGMMGHTHIVIAPSESSADVDGWRMLAQCTTLEFAKRDLKPGQEIWRRVGKSWEKVLAAPGLGEHARHHSGSG